VLAEANVTGVRLGRVVLCYVALTVAVITLSPFHFRFDGMNSLSYEWTSYDAVMNVVLFVPIGFIYQLSRRRGIAAGWGTAFVIGAVLSTLIEGAQMFEPNRHPSLADLVTNTIGAGFGAAIATAAFGRADAAKTVKAFAVELPLMGIVYLLVPLAWLAALGAGDTARAWGVVPLTLCAGWIIGAAFSSFERAPLGRVLFATAAWIAVALAPAAIDSPLQAAVGAASCLAASVARSLGNGWFTREVKGAERRFEARTLRVVIPILCAYLIWSSLVPVVERPAWLGYLSLFRSTRAPSNISMFRALEHITAFTLIGYAIAEYGGRVREEFRQVVVPVLLFAIVASAILEVARGAYTPYGASATLYALTLLGALLGGWLYVLQLAHVRALIGHRKSRELRTQP
jgi:VanZ family protein